ncbi:hypothetical protein G6F33_010608 [Rhizopus arrhizus]|nr:hypothetical protein G6F33_010608 [Rhizopus arrhizus]
MFKLSFAEVLNPYSAITRSLNLDMKLVLQDMVFQAISLLNQGKSVREVEELTDLSKSTVGRLRKTYCTGVMKPNRGRRKVLSAADERYCVRQFTKNRVPSAVKVAECLENDIGKKVGVETVRRALRKAGLGAIEKPKKPLLSAKIIRNRLSWYITHKDWTVDDWKRVIWSDEAKINRFNSDGRTWAWIRSWESLKSRHVKMTVKHGGGSIMLWSAITYAGVGWMCKINVNMDKELYKEILEDELERTIEYGVNRLGFERHQVIFQHDNDPKHTSKVVKEYLQKQSYTVLQWPAQSPDLNPIENMWSLLKRRLNDYETAPKGMNELYERVTKVWCDLMKPEECQKVIESMPQRIHKCIQNKGRWTDY